MSRPNGNKVVLKICFTFLDISKTLKSLFTVHIAVEGILIQKIATSTFLLHLYGPGKTDVVYFVQTIPMVTRPGYLRLIEATFICFFLIIIKHKLQP